MTVFFTKEELNALEEEVKKRLSTYRFNHTLGVARAAERLGSYIMPQRCSELIAAALLHDIAKELDDESTALLLNESGFKLSGEDLAVKPALHSISGAALIKRDFPLFATPSVISAVYNHTVGSPDMDLFSEIIFIADYIEEGRTYFYSKVVADFIFESFENKANDKVKILHRAVDMILSHTIASLNQKSRSVHSRAYLTKSWFASLI